MIISPAPRRSQMLDPMGTANKIWDNWFDTIFQSCRRGEIVEASYYEDLNIDLADQVFFVASDHYRVAAVRAIFTASGSDSGSVGAQIRRCTGTQAPSAGTAILSSAIDLKATANTVQNGSLSTTAADLELNDGDRLAVTFSGTLTAVTGLAITVTLRAI